MTRLRATAVHLALSVSVGVTLLGLFLFVWYPVPLFRAVGGQTIFLMLLGIDVALGPLLTFVVFRPGKSFLRFDLAVVALLQLSALVYGVHVLLLGRPVYIAALGHRFDVVQASDVAEGDLMAAHKSLPIWGPEWVGTKLAEDNQERERILFGAIGGADYGSYPQHHQPLGNMRAEIVRNSLPIANLSKFNPGGADDIRSWLKEHGRNELNTVFQGLKARSEDMTVMIDKKTGDVIGIAPFKPWD